MQLRLAYSLSAYPTSVDSARQLVQFVETDTTFALDMPGGVVFDTTYYVALWLRNLGTKWSAPTDSSRDTLRTPPFTWEAVTFFDYPQRQVTAMNDRIILRKEDQAKWSVTRTIRAYTPSSVPAGFVPTGIGISFDDPSQLPPFSIGMKYPQSIADSIPETALRIYRDSGGVFVADHGGTVDTATNTVWTTASDLHYPFVLLADTSAPSAVLADDTDIATPISTTAPLPYGFEVSDNVGNVAWTFLSGKGHEAYTDSTGGMLDSTSGTIRATVHADSISDAYGLRAILIVSDGVWRDTLNVSRSVLTDTIESFVTLANAWTPLRTPGLLDSTRFRLACAGLSEGTTWNYDVTRFRAFRWVADPIDSTSWGRWTEYADSLDTTMFRMTPGKVVWVKTRDARNVLLGKGRTTPLHEPYRLRLAPRAWTDFSAAFRFPVKLCDVLRATDAAHGHDTLGGFTDTLQFLRWARSENTYVVKELYTGFIPSLAEGRDTAVIQYSSLRDAYCVYNPFDTAITLSVPGLPPVLSSCRSDGVPKRTRVVRKGWDIGIASAVEGGGALNTVRCGVAEGVPGDVTFPIRPSFARCGVGVVRGPEGRLQAHSVVPAVEKGGVTFEIVYYNDASEPVRIRSTLLDRAMVPRPMEVRVFAPEKSAYLDKDGEFAVTVPAQGAVTR
jgi:hypothetical protein